MQVPESGHVQESGQVMESAQNQQKKKNPYSIEELLKKPEKKKSTNTNTFIHQPCGLLVDNPCSCNLMGTSL